MNIKDTSTLALLALGLILQGCDTGRVVTMDEIGRFSPPMVQTSKNQWQRAQEIAANVPNSRLVVGHGDGMLPLYAHGTVLVLQRLAWDHLRPGMTVVYGPNPAFPFGLVCHVIDEKAANGGWSVWALSDDEPDPRTVTEENYVGTVVAAIQAADKTPANLPASLAHTQEAYCLLRCHIDGDIHPKVAPLTPAAGAATANRARPSRVEAQLLARILPGQDQ